MKGHKAHHEHHGVMHEKISPRHIHHKAHELVHARKRGGKVAEGSWPHEGEDEAEEDLRDHEESHEEREHEEEGEAKAMRAKRGGHVKKARKHGGHVEKKHVGNVAGKEYHHHAGRKPRKSGGSCEASPFSSARSGTAATGRKLERETMD